MSGGQSSQYLSHANVAHAASWVAFALLSCCWDCSSRSTPRSASGWKRRPGRPQPLARVHRLAGRHRRVAAAVGVHNPYGERHLRPRVESDLDLDMIYYALRAVIACVYIWCAFSLRKKALQLAASARGPSAAHRLCQCRAGTRSRVARTRSRVATRSRRRVTASLRPGTGNRAGRRRLIRRRRPGTIPGHADIPQHVRGGPRAAPHVPHPALVAPFVDPGMCEQPRIGVRFET